MTEKKAIPPLTETQKALVEEHYDYARKVTTKLNQQYHFTKTGGVEMEDLYQTADLALMQAAQHWDENRNTRFTTYSYVSIRNALIAYAKKYSIREDDCIIYEYGYAEDAAENAGKEDVAFLDVETCELLEELIEKTSGKLQGRTYKGVSYDSLDISRIIIRTYIGKKPHEIAQSENIPVEPVYEILKQIRKDCKTIIST